MAKNRKHEWSDNERFWLATYAFEFDAKRFALAQTEVSGVLNLVAIPQQAAILDMACGPGRHCLELARRGYRVSGVDITAGYIKTARENARLASLNIEYIVGDSRDFERADSFDLVLNLFTSFGYFEHDSDNLLTLKHAYNSLKSGGHMVIDTVNGPYIADQKIVKDERHIQGTTLDEVSIVSADKRTLRGHWAIKTPDLDERHFDYVVHLYSGQQLTDLLKQAGFSDVRIWGGLHGPAYQEGSPRLVAAATK